MENGSHVLFGSRLGSYRTGEIALAEEALGALQPGMLCLSDRYFYSFALWRQAQGRRADLAW